ncbi:MAG: hypothetical protein AAF798_14350 [Bacteroidota bacterium]
MKSIFLVCIAVVLSCASTVAQSDTELPAVFPLGANEKAYEQLGTTYAQSILEVAGNDIELASEKWLDLMKKMEDYSSRINYDIKGLKVWFHMFFAADGSIDHVGYILRENSRNFDENELKAFLKSFASTEKLDLSSTKQFSFYTGATFPVFAERYSGN